MWLWSIHPSISTHLPNVEPNDRLLGLAWEWRNRSVMRWADPCWSLSTKNGQSTCIRKATHRTERFEGDLARPFDDIVDSGQQMFQSAGRESLDIPCRTRWWRRRRERTKIYHSCTSTTHWHSRYDMLAISSSIWSIRQSKYGYFIKPTMALNRSLSISVVKKYRRIRIIISVDILLCISLTTPLTVWFRFFRESFHFHSWTREHPLPWRRRLRSWLSFKYFPSTFPPL